MTDGKKRNLFLLLSKIAYFPFALVACCQLALWGSVWTDVFIWGDPARLTGGHYVVSAASLFVLLPIWFCLSLLACLVAFFRLRKKTPPFVCAFLLLAGLSVFFFLNITESLPWSTP